MNWKVCISGGLFLILAGFVGADYLSTTISTDGSCVLASAGLTSNGSYISRVMAAGVSEITRSVTKEDNLFSDFSVKSSGPILVSDYASGRMALIPDSVACAFMNHVREQEEESEIYSMGILSNGRYTASRVVGPGLTGDLDVHGTGMMNIGSLKIGNDTLRSSGFVSGNMTVRDFVKYGGRI